MTKEEITRAELIREEVRKAINQIIDEEYNEIIKEMEENQTKLSNRDIIDELLSPKIAYKESK